VQITTRASPTFDDRDIVSNTSTASSVKDLQRTSLTFDRAYPSTISPLLNEYQQPTSNHINYKFFSPVLNTNTTPSSSLISSLPSSTSSFPASYTCPKGHEQSSSLLGSSLNQYIEFASQTQTADTSRDDIGHPSTTTRSVMTVSLSPNRHLNQTRLVNAIIRTNNKDEIKQQHQIES
jgi:hypothetical protein